MQIYEILFDKITFVSNYNNYENSTKEPETNLVYDKYLQFIIIRENFKLFISLNYFSDITNIPIRLDYVYNTALIYKRYTQEIGAFWRNFLRIQITPAIKK